MIKKGAACCIVLVIILLMGNTALATGIPPFTIVIGNKGFSLNYVMDLANEEEVSLALRNTDFDFIFKDLEGAWVDSLGKPVDSSTIPAVIYKDGSEIKEYEAGDGEERPLSNYATIKANFRVAEIGLYITVFVENYEGASKFVVYEGDEQVSQIAELEAETLMSPIHIKLNDEITVNILDEDERVLLQGNLSVVNGEVSVIVESEEIPNNNLEFKVTDIY